MPSVRTLVFSVWSLAAATTRADDGATTPPPPPVLAPSLSYEGTVLSDVSGGVRRGTTYVGNLHLKLAARGDRLGHPGTSAFLDVLSIHGGAPTRLVGDTQDTSNIEGPVGTEVEEAWVQHDFRGERVSLLAGLYDLNSEFYSLQAAGLFLNGSFGIGPEFAQSGVGGPSIFPRTSVGLRLTWKPQADSALRVAVLDGAPLVRDDGRRVVLRRGDGALAVVEFDLQSHRGEGSERPTEVSDPIGRFASLAEEGDKFGIGVWHYTASFDDLSDRDAAGRPVRRRGSSGLYAIGERALVGGADAPRLSAFFQAGVADPRMNHVGTYLGAGLVATGWGVMPRGDQAGLAVARANAGSHARHAADAAAAGGDPSGPMHRSARAETTVELSYLTQLARRVAFQPDLQYVIHPNADRAIPNAWVLQCRFQVEF